MEVIRLHCFLPEDLIIDILVNLPVKPLLRFKCVSKEWHSIITNPNFINRHLHNKRNNTHLLVQYHGREFSAFSLFSEKDRIKDSDDLNLPGPIWALRGPCNGIYCLITTTKKVALWNPSTRRLRQIMPDSIIKDFGISEIGFGIDRTTDELKIVWISLTKLFFVWSSRTECWKRGQSGVLFECRANILKNQGLYNFSNGFYYWMKYNYMTRTSSIFAFNMHNEVFHEINLPHGSRLKNKDSLCRIDLYNGSLALFSFDDGNQRSFDIWVLKEEGDWGKVSTLVFPYDFGVVLGFSLDHKIFELSELRELKIFDPDTNTARSLRIKMIEGIYDMSLHFSRYEESFVSIKGKFGAQDYDTQSVEAYALFDCYEG